MAAVAARAAVALGALPPPGGARALSWEDWLEASRYDELVAATERLKALLRRDPGRETFRLGEVMSEEVLLRALLRRECGLVVGVLAGLSRQPKWCGYERMGGTREAVLLRRCRCAEDAVCEAAAGWAAGLDVSGRAVFVDEEVVRLVKARARVLHERFARRVRVAVERAAAAHPPRTLGQQRAVLPAPTPEPLAEVVVLPVRPVRRSRVVGPATLAPDYVRPVVLVAGREVPGS